MILLDVVILCAVMIPDVLWQTTILGVDIKFGLVPIYFIYLSFRNELTAVLPLFVLQLILLRPFLIFGFFPLSVALLTVMFIANRVRLQIYTEAYLTQGMWVFLLSLIYQLILHLLAVNLYTHHMMPKLAAGMVANALLAFFTAVPLFLILDRFYDFFGRRRRPRGSSYMIRRL